MQSKSRAGERLVGAWNEEVFDLNAPDILLWASKNFKDGLYCLSSFGVDSAVTFDLLKHADISVPVLYIDTGFLFPETHNYREELIGRFGLEVVVAARPPQKTLREIGRLSLWENDIEEYNRLTKLEPLNNVIKQLGIRALISGVRKDQTPNRAALRVVDNGIHGEIRVHPILHWSQQRIDEYVEDNGLPRHPLHTRGYASVGDWTTTRPGRTRQESRSKLGEHTECGLHLDHNGEVRRAKE